MPEGSDTSAQSKVMVVLVATCALLAGLSSGGAKAVSSPSPSGSSVSRARKPSKGTPPKPPGPPTPSSFKTRSCAFGVTGKSPELVQPETAAVSGPARSEEHTSELQSRQYLVCRLLLEK